MRGGFMHARASVRHSRCGACAALCPGICDWLAHARAFVTQRRCGEPCLGQRVGRHCCGRPVRRPPTGPSWTLPREERCQRPRSEVRSVQRGQRLKGLVQADRGRALAPPACRQTPRGHAHVAAHLPAGTDLCEPGLEPLARWLAKCGVGERGRQGGGARLSQRRIDDKQGELRRPAEGPRAQANPKEAEGSAALGTHAVPRAALALAGSVQLAWPPQTRRSGPCPLNSTVLRRTPRGGNVPATPCVPQPRGAARPESCPARATTHYTTRPCTCSNLQHVLRRNRWLSSSRVRVVALHQRHEPARGCNSTGANK